MKSLEIKFWEEPHSGVYCPKDDSITIPDPLIAASNVYFYIRFHELIHATGHEDRIGRFRYFDSDQEEAIAEQGAALLSQAYKVGFGVDYNKTILPWCEEEIAEEAQNAIDYLSAYSSKEFILGE